MKLTVARFDSAKHASLLKKFSSEIPALRIYARKRAGKENSIGAASVYVCLAEDGRLAGFYTISMSSIEREKVPDDDKASFPEYPRYGSVHIGRLARDTDFKGFRSDVDLTVGETLVVSALEEAVELSKRISALFITVDAKTEKAAGFYEGFGFKFLFENDAFPRAMYLLMSTAASV